MRRGVLPILCVLAALVSTAAGQADAWLEVRTTHFLVVSNAAENDARLAARSRPSAGGSSIRAAATASR